MEGCAGERGAAFLLAILALLAGIGVALAVDLTAHAGASRRERASERALAQAREALIAYATDRPMSREVGPGYLPCPDLDGDGWAEATCGSQSGDTGQAQRATARNPVNYLDRAPDGPLGGGDNADFRDRNDAAGRPGNRNGFIDGPVVLPGGRVAVNDRLAVIGYRDVMPRLMRRIALEVRQCLRVPAARSGRCLPRPAAPFSPTAPHPAPRPEPAGAHSPPPLPPTPR